MRCLYLLQDLFRRGHCHGGGTAREGQGRRDRPVRRPVQSDHRCPVAQVPDMVTDDRTILPIRALLNAGDAGSPPPVRAKFAGTCGPGPFSRNRSVQSGVYARHEAGQGNKRAPHRGRMVRQRFQPVLPRRPLRRCRFLVVTRGPYVQPLRSPSEDPDGRGLANGSQSRASEETSSPLSTSTSGRWRQNSKRSTRQWSPSSP